MSYGDDIADLFVEQMVETEKGSGQFELKKITFPQAIRALEGFVMDTAMAKMMNPLNWRWKKTNKLYAFTKKERIMQWNGDKMREFTRDYVQRRKAGEIKSTAKGEVDLLTLFLG